MDHSRVMDGLSPPVYFMATRSGCLRTGSVEGEVELAGAQVHCRGIGHRAAGSTEEALVQTLVVGNEFCIRAPGRSTAAGSGRTTEEPLRQVLRVEHVDLTQLGDEQQVSVAGEL